MVIPTETPGVGRPFPSICGIDGKDFNEVFFTDVRVRTENLVGPLNQGWRVANGSLGHERTPVANTWWRMPFRQPASASLAWIGAHEDPSEYGTTARW
jgi:hypothetical protein